MMQITRSTTSKYVYCGDYLSTVDVLFLLVFPFMFFPPLSTGDRDDFCDTMLEAAIRGWSHCGHKEMDTVSKNAKVDFGI